jgi:hypothetical protein
MIAFITHLQSIARYTVCKKLIQALHTVNENMSLFHVTYCVNTQKTNTLVNM